jgi:hypothetical protein
VRSSAKLGEEGLDVRDPWGSAIMVREAERAIPSEGLLDDAALEGKVGLRVEGF